MPDKIALEIVTPERRVLAKQVDDVVLPSVEGYMGVLPGHTPLLAMLDVGEISYLEEGTRHYLAVSGGFAEVLRDSVSILAETSEAAEEIDAERAELSKQRAEKALETADKSASQFEEAEVRLKRAISRLRVHDRLRH
jgi:F-type H+-transporting ATPase subunit epsilon